MIRSASAEYLYRLLIMVSAEGLVRHMFVLACPRSLSCRNHTLFSPAVQLIGNVDTVGNLRKDHANTTGSKGDVNQKLRGIT